MLCVYVPGLSSVLHTFLPACLNCYWAFNFLYLYVPSVLVVFYRSEMWATICYYRVLATDETISPPFRIRHRNLQF